MLSWFSKFYGDHAMQAYELHYGKVIFDNHICKARYSILILKEHVIIFRSCGRLNVIILIHGSTLLYFNPVVARY